MCVHLDSSQHPPKKWKSLYRIILLIRCAFSVYSSLNVSCVTSRANVIQHPKLSLHSTKKKNHAWELSRMNVLWHSCFHTSALSDRPHPSTLARSLALPFRALTDTQNHYGTYKPLVRDIFGHDTYNKKRSLQQAEWKHKRLLHVVLWGMWCSAENNITWILLLFTIQQRRKG